MKKEKLSIINIILTISIFILLIFNGILFIKIINVLNNNYDNINNAERMVFQSVKNHIYDVDALIEVDKFNVKVNEKITLKKPSLKVYIYLPFLNNCSMDSLNVKNNDVKRIIIEGSTLAIDYNTVCKEVYLEYSIKIPTYNTITQYNADNILLTHILAVEAVLKNNQPIFLYSKDFGDPYIYESTSYNIKLKIDSVYKPFAPGFISKEIIQEKTLYHYQIDKLRDFPIAMFKNPQIFRFVHNNIKIYLVNINIPIQYITQALNFAENYIGKYPYDEFFIIGADLEQSGMEFSNMIFINKNLKNNSNKLKKIVFHEIFHQWFYNIIGTNQVEEPFFDEGMVTFLSNLLSKDGLKIKLNNTNFLRLKLSNYVSKAQYYDLCYNNAAAYFQMMYENDKKKFLTALKQIYKYERFKILYFEDFKKYIEYAGD